MPDLSARIDRPELMDSMNFETSVMRKTLDFLGVTARHFGGAASIIDHLSRWSDRWEPERPISLLDVGTGGAEIPIAVARWARRTGHDVRITALDLIPDIADIARTNTAIYPEIEVRCADVFDLRAQGESFDYVTASLFLHHVSTPRIIEILKLFDALARRGVLINDLRRSAASYWAVKSLSLLIGNHVVRHDAPLSVQRSFTRNELEAFAREASLPYLHADAAPWFRLSLAGEKS